MDNDRPYIVWAQYVGEGYEPCWWVSCHDGLYACWLEPSMRVKARYLTIPMRDVHCFVGDKEEIVEIQNANNVKGLD